MQILITNLTTHLVYNIKLQAASRSLYEPDLLYRGEPTLAQKIRLTRDCDQIQAFTVLEADKQQKSAAVGVGAKSTEGFDTGTGIIAGASLVLMLLVLIVAAFVLKR